MSQTPILVIRNWRVCCGKIVTQAICVRGSGGPVKGVVTRAFLEESCLG